MTVDIVIAGRRIRLHSREGVSFRPDERFSAFTVTGGGLTGRSIGGDLGLFSGDARSLPAAGEPDLFVEVEAGTLEIPPGAVKVFDARLMEEVPGGVRNTGEPFWEIFTGDEATYARVYLQETGMQPVLEMPHGAKRWRIFAGGDDTDRMSPSPVTSMHSQDQDLNNGSPIAVNPLPYPLDGLLLYFLFSQGGDIMIHGSGVVSGGRGWLFSGRSGSGKTTMARIFDGAGDRVIHDDRLVLRREGSGWVMHNTPVYRNDEPRSAPLDHLWVIRHGSANVSEPVAGAEAVAMILSNCIQQNWDREAASRLAAAADELAASVKVSRLSFLPDASVRDYLALRQTENKTVAAAAVTAMLGEERPVTVTAGGYSMWPSIRPGDSVVLEPAGNRLPEVGEIIALRRDGGFVIHRVTRVTPMEGGVAIHTRGDAVMREDEPVNIGMSEDEPAGTGMIAGVVRYVIRSGRQSQPSPRRMPRWVNRLVAVVATVLRGRMAGYNA